MNERHPNAGRLRVVGVAEPGHFLVAHEVKVDVCDSNGEWIPLRGVVSFNLALEFNRHVARMQSLEVEIGQIDLSLPADQVRRVSSLTLGSPITIDD